MPLILPHGFIGHRKGVEGGEEIPQDMRAVKITPTARIESTNFDGGSTSDGLTCSMWVYFEVPSSPFILNQEFFSARATNSSSFVISRGVFIGDLVIIQGINNDVGGDLVVVSDIGIANETWTHVMFSADGPQEKIHIYINGVEAFNGDFSDITNWESPWDFDTSVILGDVEGSSVVDMSIADLWIHKNFVDLSVASNREKFYDNGPVWLGETGTRPLGTEPVLYFTATPDDDMANNRGTGTGTFTEEQKSGSITYIDSGLDYVA